MDTSQASELLTKAKSKMVLRLPFFAAIILRLVFRETSSIPTAATDSVDLLYNHEFISSLTKEEVEAVLCHEVLHVALAHVFRRRGRNPILWNIACDYVVNYIITKDVKSVKLPEKHLFSEEYKGLSAEAVYEILWKKCEKDKSLMSGLKDKVLGEVFDYSKDKDNPGHNKTADEQEAQWKLNVAQAVQAAKVAGTLPGSIERLVGKLLNPTLPWRELLSRFITEKASDDYVWTKPNKRYLYGGMYLPTLDNPKMKDIGIIIDTSGSIDNKQIREFVGEIRGILSVCPGTKAEIVYVDYDVMGHQTLTEDDIEDIKPRGGGGTRFSPGFKFFKEKDLDIACVVYLTDGCCNEFPTPDLVDWEVMWVLNTEYEEFTPPFGEVVFMIN